jgi:hypothetical protein
MEAHLLELTQQMKPERPDWQAAPNAKGRPSIDVGPLRFVSLNLSNLPRQTLFALQKCVKRGFSRLRQVFLLPRVLKSASRADKRKTADRKDRRQVRQGGVNKDQGSDPREDPHGRDRLLIILGRIR